ncbi:MAG: ferrous iron transport protein B [Sphingomonadales bacterium]
MVALVGNPNAGKSALFNALTGARQKVGNYPGVTVERHAGRLVMPDGRTIELVDLPGTYSLTPSSPDERVTRDTILGQQEGERTPSVLVVVVDAANLDNHLRFAIELIALGRPVVVALNMFDLAERDGLTIDVPALAQTLGVPVIPTVAVRKRGLIELKAALDTVLTGAPDKPHVTLNETTLTERQRHARRIAKSVTVETGTARRFTESIDKVVLHPIAGPIILAVLMFVMFQAVFTLAAVPQDMIDGWIGSLKDGVKASMPDTLLRSLLADGIIAGVGAVVVFLPQIVILFAFILVLEASGYMVRAAFLMDRLMSSVGLSGRAFIPLLSSFACAIPGIMATRTIEDPKDRLTTILIAPLMTCSARLPVYAVIIAAFIPPTSLAPGIGLQGVVLFVLYLAGIIGALVAALLLRRTVTKGKAQGFMMEMPKYQWPAPRDLALGLWQRAMAFLKRAGTIILFTTVVLWVLLSFPRVPDGSPASQIDHSIAGRIADGLAVVVKPIGFDRDIALALIPAMAAREVAVSALATVNAIDNPDETQRDNSLAQSLRGKWSLATALAFLAWFVFAPQCISTIAVVRRETNGWKWPGFMLLYLFALAYVAAGITYWSAVALGL